MRIRDPKAIAECEIGVPVRWFGFNDHKQVLHSGGMALLIVEQLPHRRADRVAGVAHVAGLHLRQDVASIAQEELNVDTLPITCDLHGAVGLDVKPEAFLQVMVPWKDIHSYVCMYRTNGAEAGGALPPRRPDGLGDGFP